MSYQRCISTLGCPSLTLLEALALAHAHGLDAIEPRALGGRIDLPTYFAECYGTPAALAAQIATSPIRIAALDTSLRLFAHTAADRAEFLEFVPWAEALGVPRLRIFDGGTDVATDLPTAVETMAWWTTLRAHHGWNVQLMVETHDALRNADAILHLAAACPDLGILWDTHHTWKVGGESPPTTWARIGPHVVHVHVKESVSRPSGHHAFSYVLPGSGEFPMADLQPVLAAHYPGPVSLEWEVHWHPDLAPVSDALQAAATAAWW